MSAGISAALTMATPPVPAPTGRVALVATNVAGGSALWDRDPEATSAALRLASALFKRLLVDHRGYEVRADGERFLVAFPAALAAARFCLDLQEALLEAEWPEALLAIPEAGELTDPEGNVVQRGLRVGMAIHVGQPEIIQDDRSRRTEYEGPDVAWVERVVGAVQGGQILLTAEAWGQVEEAGTHLLDADVTDLGRHRFPGREEAVGLVQLLPWRVANRTFPDVRTALNLKTNLPSDPGLFLGRDRLLAAIDRYFQKGRKVVTLKGPGGIGKTRLALRYGGLHVHEYGDGGGVWFCDLAGARSIDGVCHAVARALSIPLTARSLKGTQQLAAALASRGRCLLILDNFEQVEQYAEYTAALWARKAPRLRILVTSRHRLGVPGEAIVEVTPLDSDEAVALFEARAADLRPDLDLDEAARETIHDVVERVECMPLAVELAAAWLSVLTIEGVAQRLEGGHRGLDGAEASAEVHPRHRSLAQVMESSWELLSPWEREALASCSVFRGGFTAELAQQVVDLSRYRHAPAPLTVLKRLRDTSLVATVESSLQPGMIRWTLYESVQEFAAEKLRVGGLRATLEQRHARTLLALADTHLPHVRGPEGAQHMDRVAAELDNLLAVHERFVERHPRTAIRAALALDPVLATRGPFDLHLEVLDGAVRAGLNIKGSLQVPARLARAEALLTRGRLTEAAEAVSEALEALTDTAGTDVRAWASAVNGWTLTRLGKVRDGIPALETAAATLGGLNHPHGPIARYRLGRARLEAGLVEEAREDLSAARVLVQRARDAWLEVDVLTALGDLARHQGEPERGRSHYEEALGLCRSRGDKPREAQLLARYGSVSLDLRQNEAAREAFERSEALTEEVGDALAASMVRGNLGRMHHHEGRGAEAEEAYERCLEALETAGAVRWQGIFRGVLAALQHEQGRLEEAGASYIAARELLEGCGERRFAGLVWARHGALFADLGRTSEASQAFAIAREHLEAVDDPLGLAALHVHEGHLDLARARGGHAGSRKAARERFRAATTPSREGERMVQPAAAISNDVRLALRLLRRSMELEAQGG
jgi:predicted ATPase